MIKWNIVNQLLFKSLQLYFKPNETDISLNELQQNHYHVRLNLLGPQEIVSRQHKSNPGHPGKELT